MKKRILSMLIASAMFAALLSSCATPAAPSSTPAQASESAAPVETAPATESAAPSESAPAASSAPTKVSMLTWIPEDQMKEEIAFLNKTASDNNITFDYQFVDSNTYDTVLNTQLAAGQCADILQLGAQFKGTQSAGYLMDLTDQPFISKFSDTFLSGFTVDGKTYAVPMCAFFAGILYNKTIFQKYNITTPKTWDEFMAIGDKLKGSGVDPFVVGAKTMGVPTWTMFGVLNCNFYSNPDNLKNFDTAFDKGTKTVSGNWNDALNKYWSQMITKGYITKDMIGMEDQQASDYFASEKAAMLPAGSWYLSGINAKNPNIQLGMFPYPTPDGSTGWLVGAAGNGFSINANTKVKDACLIFLNALSTEEGQRTLFAHDQGPTGLKGVTFDLGPIYAECSDAFAAGHTYATWPAWTSAGPLLDDLTKGLQQCVAGTMTIDDMLKQFDQQAADLR